MKKKYYASISALLFSNIFSATKHPICSIKNQIGNIKLKWSRRDCCRKMGNLKEHGRRRRKANNNWEKGDPELPVEFEVKNWVLGLLGIERNTREDERDCLALRQAQIFHRCCPICLALEDSNSRNNGKFCLVLPPLFQHWNKFSLSLCVWFTLEKVIFLGFKRKKSVWKKEKKSDFSILLCQQWCLH